MEHRSWHGCVWISLLSLAWSCFSFSHQPFPSTFRSTSCVRCTTPGWHQMMRTLRSLSSTTSRRRSTTPVTSCPRIRESSRSATNPSAWDTTQSASGLSVPHQVIFLFYWFLEQGKKNFPSVVTTVAFSFQQWKKIPQWKGMAGKFALNGAEYIFSIYTRSMGQ